ncbi:MAG: hypothetical protein GF350_02285 [Chitinivibrionales bacterium]|nr:hypothetical protein [Chitinivibrionales bacterium]
MEKAKNSRPLKHYLFRFLGDRFQHAFFRWTFRKNIRQGMVHFPVNHLSVTRLCFILPTTPFDALFHIDSIFALISRFKKAENTVICDYRVAPYFSKLPNIGAVWEFDGSEMYAGSRELENLCSLLGRESCALCFLLEKNPPLPLLVLAACTGAPIRAGFWSRQASPFVNVCVRPGEKATYIAEKNMLLARLFGAKHSQNNRWVVSKNSCEEVRYLLEEAGIKFSLSQVGIDATTIFYEFGEQWTERLLHTLVNEQHVPCYLYVPKNFSDERLLVWLKKKNIPIISNLSVPQTAALIEQSRIVVSGKSTLYQLANLLKKPSIGIFREAEKTLYCKPSSQSRGIAFDPRNADRALNELHSLLQAAA